MASVLLVCGPAVVSAGALRECMQGCRVVQTGCVEDVQAAYQSARADCEATSGGRECTRAGHPFGDHLTDAQRRALIEYLKTL